MPAGNDLLAGYSNLPHSSTLFTRSQSPRYVGDQVVFAVSAGRHYDLVPANNLTMVYGRGQRHFGCYGLAEDCLSWFTSAQAQEAKESCEELCWGQLGRLCLQGRLCFRVAADGCVVAVLHV